MNTLFINLMRSSLVAAALLSAATTHLSATVAGGKNPKHSADNPEVDAEGLVRGNKRTKTDTDIKDSASAPATSASSDSSHISSSSSSSSSASAATPVMPAAIPAASNPDIVDGIKRDKLEKDSKTAEVKVSAPSGISLAPPLSLQERQEQSASRLRQREKQNALQLKDLVEQLKTRRIKRNQLNQEMEHLTGKRFLAGYRKMKGTMPYRSLLASAKQISEMKKKDEKISNEAIVATLSQAQKPLLRVVTELNILMKDRPIDPNKKPKAYLLAQILVQQYLNLFHRYHPGMACRLSSIAKALVHETFYQQRFQATLVDIYSTDIQKASSAANSYARYLVAFAGYEKPTLLQEILERKHLPPLALNVIRLQYALLTNKYLDDSSKDIVTAYQLWESRLLKQALCDFKKSGYKYLIIKDIPLLNNLWGLKNIPEIGKNAATVEKIFIDKCGLETLHANIFGDEKTSVFPNLKELNLQGNKISVLAINCFAGLPKKCMVALGDNPCINHTESPKRAAQAKMILVANNNCVSYIDIKLPQTTSCSVCLECPHIQHKKRWVINQLCGHLLCNECQVKMRAANKPCPECRQVLNGIQFVHLQSEKQAEPALAPAPAPAPKTT